MEYSMNVLDFGWWTVLHVRAALRGSRGGGQSTVEYAVVGALVVIAAAGALTLLGAELNAVFSNITNTLKTAASVR